MTNKYEIIVSEFERWIIKSGVKQQTVKMHTDHVRVYLIEYVKNMKKQDEWYAMDPDCPDVFFEQWYPTHKNKVAAYAADRWISSLKKLSSFFVASQRIDRHHGNAFLKRLNRNKDRYRSAIKKDDRNDGKQRNKRLFNRLRGWIEQREHGLAGSWDESVLHRWFDAYECTNEEERYDKNSDCDHKKEPVQPLTYITVLYSHLYEFWNKCHSHTTHTDRVMGVKTEDACIELYFVFRPTRSLGAGLLILPKKEGLRALDAAWMTLHGDEPDEMFQYMQGVFIDFVPARQLSTYDQKLITLAGYECEQADLWPKIRYLEPGFLSRQIYEEEIPVLAASLILINRCMDRFIQNAGESTRSDAFDTFILFTFDRFGQKIIDESWEPFEAYRSIDLKERTLAAGAYYEIDIRRVQKKCKPCLSTWEVDVFYLDIECKMEGKTFCPAILLIVDVQKQTIVGHDMQPSFKTERFAVKLMNMMLEQKRMPKQVRTRNMGAHIGLIALFDDLGIEWTDDKPLLYTPKMRRTIGNMCAKVCNDESDDERT